MGSTAPGDLLGDLLETPPSTPSSFYPSTPLSLWLKQCFSYPLFFWTPHPSQTRLGHDLVFFPLTEVLEPRPGAVFRVQGSRRGPVPPALPAGTERASLMQTWSQTLGEQRQGAHSAHNLQQERGHAPGSDGGTDGDESRTKDMATFGAGVRR